METTVERPDTADELIRAAHARAYRYPDAFGGFRAAVEWQVGDRSGHGSVAARPGPEIEVVLEGADEDDRRFVERELRSIVGHRQASEYEHGDGRHTKRLADSPGHALGTLVELGDEYDSSYRLAGGEISTVTRTMGGSRFTIVVHDRAAMPDGTALPTAFTVFYWDTETGALTKAEAYRDEAIEVGGVFLPHSRQIVRGDADGLTARRLRLSEHVLMAGETR